MFLGVPLTAPAGGGGIITRGVTGLTSLSGGLGVAGLTAPLVARLGEVLGEKLLMAGMDEVLGEKLLMAGLGDVLVEKLLMA